ncbi:MAG: SRPBCC family protein [Bacteroidota bacterium]
MYRIDPNLSKAETLPADFYHNPVAWEAAKEKIFARSWQFLGDEQLLFAGPENLYPLDLLPGYIDEPLLLSRVKEEVKCLSNVCTHRGMLLAQHPQKARKITCEYHGRRFGLDGTFEFMPEFKTAEDFPRPCEHLAEIPLRKWRQFLFTSLAPQQDFDALVAELEKRLYFLDLENMTYRPQLGKVYNVSAHWALYLDNYMEGFHVPFVHNDLGALLDYGSYKTECDEQSIIQIGYASKGDFTFDLPPGHPDYGRDVTAYYLWAFPNFMLNVYPWGVQYNIVRPLTPTFTKVEFIWYVHDQKTFDLMNGAQLAEKTEREDEFVVEAVQRGLRSRFYPGGRFSPKRENGVHRLHQLLAQSLAKD